MRKKHWTFTGRPRVRIFDPQLRDDLCFPEEVPKKDAWFSSLDNDCVVVEASWKRRISIGRIPIEAFRVETLQRVFSRPGHWFANVYPLQDLEERDRLAGAKAVAVGDAMFAELPPGSESIRLFFRDLREGHKYGEWTIGVATQPLDTSDAPVVNKGHKSTDLFYFLFQFESIGAIWSVNFDSGELFICFRAFTDYRSTIGALMRELNPPSVQP